MAKRSNTAELATLAQCVRERYFFERHQFQIRTRGEARGFVPKKSTVAAWDGGQDSRGVRHAAIWPKLVAYALAHGVDPEALIRATFFRWESSEPPLPTHCLTEEMIGVTRHFRASQIEHLQHVFMAQVREAEQQVLLKQMCEPNTRDGDLWHEVLTSPTLSAGPLIRFGLACYYGQAELARRLQENAKMEYLQGPDEYDAVMAAYLPESFRAEARAYLKSLAGESAK